MIRALDTLVRSNLTLYHLVRSSATYLCRYLFLEEGFSFLKHVQPTLAAIAIDVGSNDGTSIEMIRRSHSDVLIHSFDPVINPKKTHQGVVFHKIALSDECGDLFLHVPKVSKWTLTQYSSSDREKVTTQLIGDFNLRPNDIEFSVVISECLPLDSLQLKPFFIKIDVEGHEESVIRGALETISKWNPILLIEIQSLDKYRTMRTLLESIGYFNLEWPQSKRVKSFGQQGTYSARRNNYLWLPTQESKTWTFS